MAKVGGIIDIRPNKTRPNWYFSTFDQIAEMHKNPNKSPGQELASELHRLGLGTFIQDAWKWQHEALCEDFVQNFNHAKMCTTAFGTEVDLSLETFVSVTGLSSHEGDELYPEEEPSLAAFAPSWKKFFASDAYDARSKGFALSKCKDSGLNMVFEILNETAWMRRLQRTYKHAPKDLVYLMCHCVERKKRVNWGKTIHRKFVDELTRLYMTLSSNKKEKPTTRAGPLMCFLFAKFMDPVRHHSEESSDEVSCPANPEETMVRESTELFAEEEKWDDERESRSSWEEVGIGSEGESSPTRANTPDGVQKGTFSSTMDGIVKVVESSFSRDKEGSTFAELYREEQKHAEECLKAKLAAERTAESLRAELKEIKRKRHNQFSTAASVEEQFAKHQVVVLRQRLEKSIVERDQARAENKQLKQILAVKHR
ncbi:unnamed protein product [Calypogeia fissa]